jgi:hypothetical protein
MIKDEFVFYQQSREYARKNGQKPADMAPSEQVQLRIYQEKWGKKMEKGGDKPSCVGLHLVNRVEPYSPFLPQLPLFPL